MSEGFDYGTEEEVAEGAGFKNPTEGPHTAVIRSIIHCGLYCETYTNKGVTEVKKPAAQIVVIFELKDEEDFEDDGVTPLTLAWTLPLKAGDRASATKFRKAIDSKGKLSGFDDFIGMPCTVDCKGSKDKNDDDTPKYINFGGISGLAPKFAKMVDPLTVEGSGHISFDNITKEAILELNPITHVHKIVMQGEKYEGSVAESIIEEIRKENPEYAVPSKKEKEDKKSEGAKPEVDPDLDEDKEY